MKPWMLRGTALALLIGFAVMITLANRYVNEPVVIDVGYVEQVNVSSGESYHVRRNMVSTEIERLLRDPDRRPDSIRVCEFKFIDGGGFTQTDGRFTQTDCEVLFESRAWGNLRSLRIHELGRVTPSIPAG